MAMTCINGARECDGCGACLPDPAVIGKCAGCHDDIHVDEDFYDLPDEILLHEDCLRDWAKQFLVEAT